MTQTIDAAAFQQMVIHAAAAISAQKQHINDLNAVSYTHLTLPTILRV